MGSALRRLVSESADGATIKTAATAQGMRSLWHNGVDKVLAGLTTPEEIRGALLVEED
jgi:general secretion pathway protein E